MNLPCAVRKSPVLLPAVRTGLEGLGTLVMTIGTSLGSQIRYPEAPRMMGANP